MTGQVAGRRVHWQGDRGKAASGRPRLEKKCVHCQHAHMPCKCAGLLQHSLDSPQAGRVLIPFRSFTPGSDITGNAAQKENVMKPEIAS